MRAILVDWLVEVQESFELNHETLYTAVKTLDLYMSKKSVNKEALQLVGATACLIACKIDERIPPMLDDFVYVCDDAYSRRQLMEQEREVLAVVGFDVGYPLSYRFVRRYGRVSPEIHRKKIDEKCCINIIAMILYFCKLKWPCTSKINLQESQLRKCNTTFAKIT